MPKIGSLNQEFPVSIMRADTAIAVVLSFINRRKFYNMQFYTEETMSNKFLLDMVSNVNIILSKFVKSNHHLNLIGPLPVYGECKMNTKSVTYIHVAFERSFQIRCEFVVTQVEQPILGFQDNSKLGLKVIKNFVINSEMGLGVRIRGDVKPNNQFRICAEYTQTISAINNYFISPSEKLYPKLAGVRYSTKLDIQKSYKTIQIR
ncbi:unnamed protein product [Lepeophtheirus salmonis]|uniref:(salmon louse) hypothetical protein n=1 Tax=Lepeophtheirus salmonis TaxID=72036 RepID=A0A7R8CQ98_LEPSM|nr:unnamed protein product [Lepeophtheirus salmonis]CAF2893507.1 unnamed protein product [Lepeophtheirus salmonis]